MRKNILLFMGILALAIPVRADIDMTLIATIDLPDSVRIQQVGSACDFNGDGYPDLLVSIDDYPGDRPEAVYLYLGGPDFDTQVDYIFRDGLSPEYYGCSYGEQVCALGDMNNDGYEDFAVGAPAYDGINWETGRVYVYFGSASPDTVADLIIEGSRYSDYMGAYLGAGDFNGDYYDDLIAVADNYPLGPRICIYLGGAEPDTVSDMQYDYDYPIIIGFLCSGSDLDNDGYDEYGWRVTGGTADDYLLFQGAENLHGNPAFEFDDGIPVFLDGDLSNDGIDDFIKFGGGYYLCLGGENFNIEPDYYCWSDESDPFIINISGVGEMLLKHGWRNDYFALYNSGIPFDTIPAAIFEYDVGHFSGSIFIGDIDADESEDIIAACYTIDDPHYLPMYLRVYSIIATGIDDSSYPNKPNDYELITCYPNPFNSTAIINYRNLEGCEINIYNIAGQVVKTFVCAGSDERTLLWDATDNHGHSIVSGVYFVAAKSYNFFQTAKLIYLK